MSTWRNVVRVKAEESVAVPGSVCAGSFREQSVFEEFQIATALSRHCLGVGLAVHRQTGATSL